MWRTFRAPHGRWSRWHRDPDTQLPKGRIEREVNRAIQRPGRRALSHQRNEAPISCESDPGRILTLHHPLRFSMPASERTLYQWQGRPRAQKGSNVMLLYYYDTIRTDRRSQCRQAIDPCNRVARRHTVRESSVQDKLMPVTLSISQRNGGQLIWTFTCRSANTYNTYPPCCTPAVSHSALPTQASPIIVALIPT